MGEPACSLAEGVEPALRAGMEEVVVEEDGGDQWQVGSQMGVALADQWWP